MSQAATVTPDTEVKKEVKTEVKQPETGLESKTESSPIQDGQSKDGIGESKAVDGVVEDEKAKQAKITEEERLAKSKQDLDETLSDERKKDETAEKKQKEEAEKKAAETKEFLRDFGKGVARDTAIMAVETGVEFALEALLGMDVFMPSSDMFPSASTNNQKLMPIQGQEMSFQEMIDAKRAQIKAEKERENKKNDDVSRSPNSVTETAAAGMSDALVLNDPSPDFNFKEAEGKKPSPTQDSQKAEKSDLAFDPKVLESLNSVVRESGDAFTAKATESQSATNLPSAKSAAKSSDHGRG